MISTKQNSKDVLRNIPFSAILAVGATTAGLLNRVFFDNSGLFSISGGSAYFAYGFPWYFARCDPFIDSCRVLIPQLLANLTFWFILSLILVTLTRLLTHRRRTPNLV